MNWHSTQNDTDSLLLVVYQGFLISAGASDTQLEYCQKGTLVGCGHVRNYVYTFLQVSSKLHMLLWQLLWSLVWWLVGSNFSYSTDKAAPSVRFGESGGRLYLQWHTVISGRVGWVSWSKWIEVGQTCCLYHCLTQPLSSSLLSCCLLLLSWLLGFFRRGQPGIPTAWANSDCVIRRIPTPGCLWYHLTPVSYLFIRRIPTLAGWR